jgi:uncharacterized protein (TIGR02118 family)
MVKIIFCLRRKPGLSREAFQNYWRTRHAPLVAERAKALGIRRYVQSHTLFDTLLNGLADQRGSTGEPFDGVAELWFDSAKALHPNDTAPPASLQAARDLLADEAAFIDLANSPIFVAQEHEILDQISQI